MTRYDDDTDFDEVVADMEQERMEAALARTDQHTHHFPEHWRGMGDPS